MKSAAGRASCVLAGAIIVVGGGALTACGGGADASASAKPEAMAASATIAQAPVRHAIAYTRTGVTAIVASTDGKSVAVAHSDGRVSLLDAGSHSEIKQ